METVDLRTKEQKREDRKRKLKEKWDRFVTWVENHWVFSLSILTVILGALRSMIKATRKNIQLNEEKRLKENYIYDRRNGHYVEIRRQPKGSEWLEIDQRYEEGESVSEILDDMGILK